MEPLAASLSRALPAGLRPAPARGQTVAIDTADPRAFWEALLGALEGGVPAALLDPAWPADWKDGLRAAAAALPAGGPARVLPATSGSTGRPRFCIHDADTLAAAAAGYAERFGRRGLPHAVCVLPQHHVGGLMPVVRSAACGGRVHFANYRDAAGLRAAPFPLREAAISLVPTQLLRMLDDPDLRALLQAFGLILTGGAACPAAVLERARAAGLRLAPCYGATETAAMVTTLDPEEYLAGIDGVGTALPHARIAVDAAGRVRVYSAANLRQYLPQAGDFRREPFATGDLGRLDAQGRLHILGRADRVIISGGENVHPEQVEAAAMATGLVSDARCSGVDDPEWGTRVELEAVSAGDPAGLAERLQARLRERLPACALPKRIRLVEFIPGRRKGGG